MLKPTTDGRESLNTAADGAVHRSTSRWEGNKLVTKWTLEDKGEVRVHGTDVRWLEDGWKVLVNDRTRRSRWMELTFHIVWVRQEGVAPGLPDVEPSLAPSASTSSTHSSSSMPFAGPVANEALQRFHRASSS